MLGCIRIGDDQEGGHRACSSGGWCSAVNKLGVFCELQQWVKTARQLPAQAGMRQHAGKRTPGMQQQQAEMSRAGLLGSPPSNDATLGCRGTCPPLGSRSVSIHTAQPISCSPTATRTQADRGALQQPACTAQCMPSIKAHPALSARPHSDTHPWAAGRPVRSPASTCTAP